jgi:hypothetical protein
MSIKVDSSNNRRDKVTFHKNVHKNYTREYKKKNSNAIGSVFEHYVKLTALSSSNDAIKNSLYINKGTVLISLGTDNSMRG